MRLSSGDRWLPEGTKRGSWRPAVGDTVAFDRAAWVVTHVADKMLTDEDEAALAVYAPAYREERRPYRLSLYRLHGPRHPRENSRKEIALGIPTAAYWSWEYYDDGRVPLCSCCSHPWPCLVGDAKEQAERQGQLLDARLSRAGVGLCYGCGEVITVRQGSVVYPEGNVDLPGYPPPRFHTRQACSGERRSYEQRRSRVYPDIPAFMGDETEGLWMRPPPSTSEGRP